MRRTRLVLVHTFSVNPQVCLRRMLVSGAGLSQALTCRRLRPVAGAFLSQVHSCLRRRPVVGAGLSQGSVGLVTGSQGFSGYAAFSDRDVSSWVDHACWGLLSQVQGRRFLHGRRFLVQAFRSAWRRFSFGAIALAEGELSLPVCPLTLGQSVASSGCGGQGWCWFTDFL